MVWCEKSTMNRGFFSYSIARKVRSIWGKHGDRRCRTSVWLIRMSMGWLDASNVCSEAHTFLLYAPFHARFTSAAESVPAYEFEIFCDIVHLLPLEICDNNVYFIAADIVHAAKKHELWQLRQRVNL